MRRKGFLIAGIICIILGISLFMLARMNEDTWIKDSRGVWIKHGMPSSIPGYVLEQQEAINCSNYLFGRQAIRSDIRLDSQCLGTCGNYSADLVHVPRTAEDDMEKNQCQAYLNGTTSHFIEYSENGSIVRIV